MRSSTRCLGPESVSCGCRMYVPHGLPRWHAGPQFDEGRAAALSVPPASPVILLRTRRRSLRVDDTVLSSTRPFGAGVRAADVSPAGPWKPARPEAREGGVGLRARPILRC